MAFTDIDVELVDQMKGFFQLTMFNLPSDCPLVKSTFYLRIQNAVQQWSNIGLTGQHGLADEYKKVTYLVNSNLK